MSKPSYFPSLLIVCLLTTVSLRAQAPAETALSPVTLEQCYEWARLQSEDLKIRGENIEQSKARARGAIGGALPQVDWKLNDTWQDPSGVKKLERQGFSGFVEKDQVESKFTAKQALFSGLREFSAMSAYKRESERDRLLLVRAERDLFDETARIFYAVIGAETDRFNTAAAYQLAVDRLKELRGFLKLGKARDSEVFTAQAHASALKGQLDQIDGRISSSRQELSYLAGQDLSVRELHDEYLFPTAAPAVDDVVTRARDRSDVRAYREDVEGRKLRIRYERGSYWPTADLTGNYYTRRATFLKDIDWDVVLEVDMPLYQGGKVSAAVREAISDYRQSLFMLQQMERNVVYQVKKNQGDLDAAIHETLSLEEAAQAARQSYDSLLKEYRLGLVTNLDVLQALDFLQEQENARDAARIKAKRLFIQLKVAIEELP